MSLGAVADVFIEIVLRVFISEIDHVVVAGDFGDDGCSGNFADFSIGFDASRDVVFERCTT